MPRSRTPSEMVLSTWPSKLLQPRNCGWIGPCNCCEYWRCFLRFFCLWPWWCYSLGGKWWLRSLFWLTSFRCCASLVIVNSCKSHSFYLCRWSSPSGATGVSGCSKSWEPGFCWRQHSRWTGGCQIAMMPSLTCWDTRLWTQRASRLGCWQKAHGLCSTQLRLSLHVLTWACCQRLPKTCSSGICASFLACPAAGFWQHAWTFAAVHAVRFPIRHSKMTTASGTSRTRSWRRGERGSKPDWLMV